MYLMKLTYETGIATQAQFIVISLLNIATQITATVTTCHSKKDSCLTSVFSSTGYFMVIVLWFGFIWMLGYMAQQRRSRKLSLCLIGAEFLVLVVSISNARHHTDILGLATSVIDALLAIWVISLAVRLMLAGNRRIVASERSRRRHRPTTDL